MATVKMTSRLKSDIIERAGDIYRKRLERHSKYPDGFGDRCYQAWLDMGNDKIIAAIQSLPVDQSSWLQTRSEITIKKINNTPVQIYMAQLSCEKPMVNGGARYWPPDLELTGNNCDALLKEYKTWAHSHEELVSRKQWFVDEISEFLNTVSTLNRALIIFPALREIVPKYDLEKVHTPKRSIAVHPTVREKVEQLTGEIVQSMILEG